jgi:hypothetical protein
MRMPPEAEGKCEFRKAVLLWLLAFMVIYLFYIVSDIRPPAHLLAKHRPVSLTVLLVFGVVVWLGPYIVSTAILEGFRRNAVERSRSRSRCPGCGAPRTIWLSHCRDCRRVLFDSLPFAVLFSLALSTLIAWGMWVFLIWSILSE